MKIVLFDMDGTLTEPRQKMSNEILESLIRLQQSDFEIGIVSGSDMNYIEEQCSILFDENDFNYEKIIWLPCNGTKRYTIAADYQKELVYNHDMKNEVGEEVYKAIIYRILDSQTSVKYGLAGKKIPLTGTFIQYRGSMINWCPIGRDAGYHDRKLWIELDSKYNIRNSLYSRLRSFPCMNTLDIKMGGDTSFDIFPKGWDKTFALKNFNESDELYFVGDRCGLTGNDREIYEAVNLRNTGQSFETSGPMKTIDIIEKSILKQRQ